MMEELFECNRKVEEGGQDWSDIILCSSTEDGPTSDWSDMVLVHFIPKKSNHSNIEYSYHILRIPNVLISKQISTMVGCETDMSFAVVLGETYTPRDMTDEELMEYVWDKYCINEYNILEKCFPEMTYSEYVAHTLMKLGVHKIERDEQNERFDERVLLDKIEELADNNPPIDFLYAVHDIDDVNYNHILYYMDDKTIAPDIYKRLKDDLLISHMYNWDDNVISHIPAFYIENADLQYIDYWDPNALDTLLENGTIKEVRRIVVI